MLTVLNVLSPSFEHGVIVVVKPAISCRSKSSFIPYVRQAQRVRSATCHEEARYGFLAFRNFVDRCGELVVQFTAARGLRKGVASDEGVLAEVYRSDGGVV